MSDKPKFEVIDRRKMKAEEEQENQQPSASPVEVASVEAASAPPEKGGGPRLVVNEPKPESAAEGELPPAPTAKESREQKTA